MTKTANLAGASKTATQTCCFIWVSIGWIGGHDPLICFGHSKCNAGLESSHQRQCRRLQRLLWLGQWLLYQRYLRRQCDQRDDFRSDGKVRPITLPPRLLSTSGLESAYSSEISYTVPNAVPGIQVTPGSIGYGTVLAGTSVTNQFVVQNAGTGTLSGSASVSAPFSVVSGGSYSLGAGQTQAVVVVFSPLAASNYTQSVSFSVSGGTGTNVTVSGSATNVSSATVPSPPSVITKTITADITNLITLQFTTNLTSPTWQTLGVLCGAQPIFLSPTCPRFSSGAFAAISPARSR